LALFEAGPVFCAHDRLLAAPRPPVTQRPSDEELAAIDRALGRQPRHLAALLTGHWLPDDWQGLGVATGWQQAIAFVEAAGLAIGVQLDRRATEYAPWHPGRCAEFTLPTGEAIGQAGELHPEVCATFGLPARTAAAEIDLDALVSVAPDIGEIPEISGFPVAKEDVALIVDADVPAAAVERALRTGAGPLLESLWLFDIYAGPQIGEGKKSLAYALRFRAPDRTLTDAETAEARNAAVAAAAERLQAVQRTV
jgi:phenylalanyl-tRNA synthetase beta chain